jgi:hypothetical protein
LPNQVRKPLESINHTLIYMTIIIMGGILILTDILLIVFRPDASNTVISATATLVGLGVTTMLTLRANRVTQQVAADSRELVANATGEIAVIRSQTDGMVSKLIDHATGTAPINTQELAQITEQLRRQREGQ